MHDPGIARERAEARKRGGQNRRQLALPVGSEFPTPLRSVVAVQETLELVIRDALALSNTAQRARTVGYLLGVALKTLELGELEVRLLALERIVFNHQEAKRL